MEKSIVRQNLKTRNYFKDTLDKLKSLNKTTIRKTTQINCVIINF